MNRALWIKAIGDAWRQLVVSIALLVLFSWVFVWLMSRFSAGSFGVILKFLPGFLQSMFGVPLEMLASPVGQVSILYVHIATFLICVGWALGRGSDSITGEISRGTMDLLVTLPIWRVSLVLIPAVVTTIGSMLLASSIMLGIWLGLLCVHFSAPVAVLDFLPGTVNLACMLFCFTGMTTLVSAGIRDRWMAFALAGGFYVLELVIKMFGRMITAQIWPDAKWIFYLSFLSPFEPQELILAPDATGHLALRYNLTFVGLGVASYALAVVIFNRRDIPGPR